MYIYIYMHAHVSVDILILHVQYMYLHVHEQHISIIYMYMHSTCNFSKQCLDNYHYGINSLQVQVFHPACAEVVKKTVWCPCWCLFRRQKRLL